MSYIIIINGDIMIGHQSDFDIQTVLAICETINTPRSLAVFILLKNGEYEQLFKLGIKPDLYSDAETFRWDYLVTEVMRKHPDLDIGIDRDAAALKSFYEGESLCAGTNKYIGTSTDPRINDVACEVSRILGPLDRNSLEFIEQNFGHGPGATACLKGTGSVKSEKFRQNHPSLTHSLIPFARALMGPRWANTVSSFSVLEGNVFTTVPKTALTNRGICIEPLLNLYGQKGVGAYIRSRLRRHGCDLNSQDRNRKLASRAQRDGLCTIDLSLASDTMSCGLVARLLEPRWLDLLGLFRSEHTTLPDGSVLPLEKFSSMGNGFTFELESLFFFALVKTVVPRPLHHCVSVYGDDIIVPAAYAAEVMSLLNLFGFKANSSKTFLAGRFFESCGADFFDGVNVRPFYFKGASHLPKEIQACNKIRLHASQSMGCSDKLRPIWVNIFNGASSLLRKCKVPVQYGDLGFIVSRKEVRFRHKHFEDCFWSHTLVLRSVTRDFRDTFVLWASPSSKFSRGRESVRGHMRRHKIVRKPLWFPSGLEWI